MTDSRLKALYRRYVEASDISALGTLFDTVAPVLLRIARRLLSEPQLAEDAVQDVFLALIELPSSYDPTRPLGPWLIGVLIHRVRDIQRRESRSPDRERLPQRTSTDPADALIGAELETAVRGAIQSLPEGERVAVTARLFDDVGSTELARRFGISAGRWGSRW